MPVVQEDVSNDVHVGAALQEGPPSRNTTCAGQNKVADNLILNEFIQKSKKKNVKSLVKPVSKQHSTIIGFCCNDW